MGRGQGSKEINRGLLRTIGNMLVCAEIDTDNSYFTSEDAKRRDFRDR